MDLLKFQQLGTHNFSNPMVTHLNVLGSRVKTWILGKMDSALAIAKQIVILLLHAQLLQEVLHP
jgi:hypothetical protein